MRRTTLLVLCTLGLTLSAFATNYPDTLKVNYFANAHSTGFSDATFYITNTGLSGGRMALSASPDGHVCYFSPAARQRANWISE